MKKIMFNELTNNRSICTGEVPRTTDQKVQRKAKKLFYFYLKMYLIDLKSNKKQ